MVLSNFKTQQWNNQQLTVIVNGTRNEDGKYSVSQKKSESENRQVVSELNSFEFDEQLPEAERKAFLKHRDAQRSYYDLLHPSIWAGPEKSRGWKKASISSEYRSIEGYEAKVAVWFPEKYEKELRPMKGVYNGKLVQEFRTTEKFGVCLNFAIIPGDTFCIVDCGANSCNYGQDAKIVPNATIVYNPNYALPECNAVYTPKVYIGSGFKFEKEQECL